MRERGEVSEANEDTSLSYFRQLRQTLLGAGYRHYEISNFALPGHEAVHNGNYWRGLPYLGLGPGAHSFDGHHIRRWNLPDLSAYIRQLTQGTECPSDGETLSNDNRYNEYIMTRLRTAEGIHPYEIRSLFGEKRERYCSLRAQTYLKSHRLRETTDGRWVLTEDGIFVADAIIADLFA